jgi:hypothetical protein
MNQSLLENKFRTLSSNHSQLSSNENCLETVASSDGDIGCCVLIKKLLPSLSTMQCEQKLCECAKYFFCMIECCQRCLDLKCSHSEPPCGITSGAI